eukprot:356602-Chlamydomonas_euryale.AAC.7
MSSIQPVSIESTSRGPVWLPSYEFGFTRLRCAALRSAPFHSVPLNLAPRRLANVWLVCRLTVGLAVHG